jgi:hypothetical protein
MECPELLGDVIFNCEKDYLQYAETKGFRQWYITLRITGLLEFVLHPKFQILENTTFRTLDLFPFSGEGGREAHTLLGPFKRSKEQ